MKKLSPAQVRLLKKIAAYQKEHPNAPGYEPSDMEWRSANLLNGFNGGPGLLEPVNTGKKERRVNHGRGDSGFTSTTWEDEILTRLTEKGLEFVQTL